MFQLAVCSGVCTFLLIALLLVARRLMRPDPYGIAHEQMRKDEQTRLRRLKS